MNRFMQLVLAAVLGSGLTFAVSQQYQKNANRVVISHVEGASPVSSVAYAQSTTGSLVPLDFTVAASKVTPAVVYVQSDQLVQDNMSNNPLYEFFYGPSAPRQRREFDKSSGSGVILNENGYIVTNYHVVRDADRVQVTLYDNSTFDAEVVGSDKDTDIAVLKIDKQGLPFLSFINSDEAKVGQWVLAVGNPFNLTSTVTAGIISAKGRNINIINSEGSDDLATRGVVNSTAIESFIQTDAAINPGNSGGALVDLNGGLLGINTAIASPTGAYSGYGFAVPSNIARKVVEDLIAYGVVQRGWLGVTVQSVNSELAKSEDLDLAEGAFITGFADNSAAEKAGLKKGDVIVKLDGISIRSNVNLIEYIGTKKPGDKVEVTADRHGKKVVVEVVLKNRQGNTEPVKIETAKTSVALGLRLEEITAKELKKLNLTSGVRVSALEKGKILDRTDMKSGFIITHVDNRPVESVKQIEGILAAKKTGDLVTFAGVYENFPREYIYAVRI